MALEHNGTNLYFFFGSLNLFCVKKNPPAVLRTDGSHREGINNWR